MGKTGESESSKLICPQCGTVYERNGNVPVNCTKCGMASIFFKEISTHKPRPIFDVKLSPWKKLLLFMGIAVLVAGLGIGGLLYLKPWEKIGLEDDPVHTEKVTEKMSITESEKETESESETETESESETETESQRVTVTLENAVECGGLWEEGVRQGKVKLGETVQIRAEEQEGMEFVRWETDCPELSLNESTDIETSFVVPECDVTIRAVFQEKPYDVYVDDKFAGSYYPQSKVELTVEPVSGGFELSGSVISTGDKLEPMTYSFSSGVWAGDRYILTGWTTDRNDVPMTVSDDLETITFTMPSGILNIYSETEEQYKVSVSGGRVSGKSSAYFSPGETVTVKVNQNSISDEKEFDRWAVTYGAAQLSDSSAEETTFTMPSGDVMLEAVLKDFEPIVGSGKITYGNGYYEGDWIQKTRNGKKIKEGTGTFYWDDGDRYEGDFVDGKRTGKGTFYFANGDRYEGDFVDGKRTGKGTYYWAEGDRYEGDWVDGERTGKGTYYWAEGDRYEGDWVDNKQTGKGTYYWADGGRFEGEWVNGERTGYGTHYYADGTSKSEQWNNGTLVQ